MRDNNIGTVRNGARTSSTSDEGVSDTPWEDKFKELTGKRLRLTANEQRFVEIKTKSREDIARERCEELGEVSADDKPKVNLEEVGDQL